MGVRLYNFAGTVSYFATVSPAGSEVHINLTVPESWRAAAAGHDCKIANATKAWCSVPRGGIMVRIRAPPTLGPIKSATVGGKEWELMADAETLAFSLRELATVPRASLQDIFVEY